MKTDGKKHRVRATDMLFHSDMSRVTPLRGNKKGETPSFFLTTCSGVSKPLDCVEANGESQQSPVSDHAVTTS